jgi:hypothetical protein
MCPHFDPHVSACVHKKCGRPHLVRILSASDPHPTARHFYTRYPSTNDRSMMSTSGRSVCSHSNVCTGSGRSMGSHSRGSSATAPSAVTSPRGRGSPMSTGGRSVCSHSSSRTGSGRSTAKLFSRESGHCSFCCNPKRWPGTKLSLSYTRGHISKRWPRTKLSSGPRFSSSYTRGHHISKR